MSGEAATVRGKAFFSVAYAKGRTDATHYAIVCSTVGALLLAVLASCDDGRGNALPASVARSRGGSCATSRSRTDTAAALLHCATGEGMLLAARRLVDEAIISAALTHNESSSGACPGRRRP